MKEIQLTQGKVALVDDADYIYVAQWKWQACKDPEGCWYAQRTDRSHGKKTVKMHRVLLASKITREAPLVDHQDGDGLNNQRYNIRACTRLQNMQNRKLNRNNVCGFKGVQWHPGTKKWRARIRVGPRLVALGIFKRLIDAAVAYDQAATRHFGVFAKLNFSYDPACYI